MTGETPALSPHIAHPLITECPRQAWAEHRLLGNCFTLSPQQIANRERGSALHNLVLENGNRVVEVVADAWRTATVKHTRQEARELGQIPMLSKDMAELKVVAARINAALAEVGISLDQGTAEEKFHWHEASAHGDVLCSGVIDWYDRNGTIVDLKTTEGSVHPDACARALVESASIMQDCAYRNALVSKTPGLAGRTNVLFLFAQSKPPYLVTPVTCDGTMRHIAETRWLRAVELWAKCLARGTGPEAWPQHVDKPIEVSAPGWVLARELEAEVMGT